MKKVLLSLAAVGLTMSANAQLLNYGFETGDILPGELVTENWEDIDSETNVNKFEFCQFEMPQPGSGIDGSNSLWVTTDVACNPWQRVVAFTNVGVQENKSYRISLWVKGEGDFNLALLKGCFNHDLALQAGNGTSYVDQTKTFTAANNDDFVRYSYVVWSPSRDVMKAKKSDFEQDEYWNQDFLRLAFTGVGNYSVDNVKIEESAVAGIACNGTVIRVDFGYATNGADLAAAAGGTLVLDPSCVSVKIDDEVAGIESVEIKSDGQFYIFLDENSYIDQSSAVSVSFTNPGGLKYSTDVAPECFDNPNCAVYSFTDEQGYYDENLIATSMAWEEAELVTSDPEADSFELDESISTFTFTFNKPVWADSPENGKPTAVLEGNGLTEELVVVPFEDCQTTLTFNRPDGSAALSKGSYTVSVNNVANEKDVATTSPTVISFEVGKVTVSETKYTEILSVLFPDAEVNGVPAGWIMYNEGEVRTAGNTYSSGPRTFSWTNSTVDKAFMFRTTSADGIGYATYGEDEDMRLTIPAGDVELRAILGAWDAGGFNVEVSILDLDNDSAVVASDKFLIANVVGNTRENQEFQQEKLRFTSTGGNYIFKVQVLGDGGYDQAVCGGLKIYTYATTEGEKADSEVVFADDFTSYENNVAPTVESGWAAYLNGSLREPGANFNYNGSRIKTGLGAKNLSAGYYCNGNYGGNSATSPSHYLIYGENEGVGALTLGNQKYQWTWYGVVWVASQEWRLLHFQLINAETDEVEYSRTDTLRANMGGAWTANADADKIQFTYTPNGGQYKLKYFVDNEAIFGNFKIETVGSLAVQYKNLLKDALADAQAELDIAMENDLFDGTARQALSDAITAYADPEFHTVREYNAAIADLAAKVKTMQTRRANITTYATALANLSALVTDCSETRYAGLESYTFGVQLLDSFGNVEGKDLSDEDLATAVSDLNSTYSLLSNLVNTCISLLTQQLADLAALIVANEDSLAANEYVIAAANALTDDQTLATQLKRLAMATIYQKIADDYNFTSYDEEYDITSADSIDATPFIQNAAFYCTAQNYNATPENYPGWEITLNSGSLASGWSASWDAYSGSATNPVVNAAIKNSWGSVDFDIAQQVTLPVGGFTYTIGACDRSNTTWSDGANVFSDTTATKAYFDADTVLVNLANMGQYYGESTTIMRGKSVAVIEGENYGSARIGARLMTSSSYGFIDNAHLYMTAKADGFDYAAAAEALRNVEPEIIDGLSQTRTDAPVAVEFFNLAGQKGAAQGVNIKIERYSDGYTVVKKVIVK